MIGTTKIYPIKYLFQYTELYSRSWEEYCGGPGGGGGCGLYCWEASEARRLSAAMLCAPLQSVASPALPSALPTHETPPPPLPDAAPGEPCPQFNPPPPRPPPPCPPPVPTDEAPGGEPRDAET